MNFKIFFICQEESNSYKDALNLFDLLPDEIKNSLEKVELIDTLNVVDLAHNSLQDITPISKEQSISFSTNPQLIGLCQTHINIWRKVAEQELDFCFVIEDNVNFSDSLTLLLSNPDIPEKLDFVNFTSTYFLSSLAITFQIEVQKNSYQFMKTQNYLIGTFFMKIILLKIQLNVGILNL